MTGALKGRCAIVTGASRGMGRAIAERFVREGASVVLCARSADELDQLRTQLLALAQPGQTVEALAADVSRPADTHAVAACALAVAAHIDVLVNNAGRYGPMGTMEEVD